MDKCELEKKDIVKYRKTQKHKNTGGGGQRGAEHLSKNIIYIYI